MKRRDGFTLAEVLITLTIIGVISALTLPAIQSNTAASRNRATLKNTMAILSQAAQNNMATEGWNFSHITDECAWQNNPESHNAQDNYSMCGLLNSNLSGETIIGDGSTGIGRPENGVYRMVNGISPLAYGSCIIYQLANGAIVGLEAADPRGKNCRDDGQDNCSGFIDVNGFAGPHREITCANGSKHYITQDNGTPDKSRTCEVERTTNADIFPIKFHGVTVELSSDAARSFLNAR